MLQRCESGEGQRIRAFGIISFQLATCFRMMGSDCQGPEPNNVWLENADLESYGRGLAGHLHFLHGG